ncbi:MAG: SecDF P1 head subdomain-containing protein [Acidimicrobiia bacterium]
MTGARRWWWLAGTALVAALVTGCGGGKDAPTETRLLELRPVVGSDEPPCDGAPAEGDVIVRPETKDGRTLACLRLGPAVVDDRDVRSAGLGETPGGPAVQIVLGRAGSANLDNFAARNLGKRMAILVRDKVLRAPTVSSSGFLGRIELIGLSQEEASGLARDLG